MAAAGFFPSTSSRIHWGNPSDTRPFLQVLRESVLPDEWKRFIYTYFDKGFTEEEIREICPNEYTIVLTELTYKRIEEGTISRELLARIQRVADAVFSGKGPELGPPIDSLSEIDRFRVAASIALAHLTEEESAVAMELFRFYKEAFATVKMPEGISAEDASSQATFFTISLPDGITISRGLLRFSPEDFLTDRLNLYRLFRLVRGDSNIHFRKILIEERSLFYQIIRVLSALSFEQHHHLERALLRLESGGSSLSEEQMNAIFTAIQSDSDPAVEEAIRMIEQKSGEKRGEGKTKKELSIDLQKNTVEKTIFWIKELSLEKDQEEEDPLTAEMIDRLVESGIKKEEAEKGVSLFTETHPEIDLEEDLSRNPREVQREIIFLSHLPENMKDPYRKLASLLREISSPSVGIESGIFFSSKGKSLIDEMILHSPEQLKRYTTTFFAAVFGVHEASIEEMLAMIYSESDLCEAFCLFLYLSEDKKQEGIRKIGFLRFFEHGGSKGSAILTAIESVKSEESLSPESPIDTALPSQMLVETDFIPLDIIQLAINHVLDAAKKAHENDVQGLGNIALILAHAFSSLSRKSPKRREDDRYDARKRKALHLIEKDPMILSWVAGAFIEKLGEKNGCRFLPDRIAVIIKTVYGIVIPEEATELDFSRFSEMDLIICIFLSMMSDDDPRKQILIATIQSEQESSAEERLMHIRLIGRGVFSETPAGFEDPFFR